MEEKYLNLSLGQYSFSKEEDILKKESNNLYIVCNNIFKNYFAGWEVNNILPHLIIKVPCNISDNFITFEFNNERFYYEINLNKVFNIKQYKDFLNNKLDTENYKTIYNNFKVFKTYIDSLKYLENLYCDIFKMGFDIVEHINDEHSRDMRYTKYKEYKDIDYNEYKKLKEELFRLLENKDDTHYKFCCSENIYNKYLRILNEKSENVKKYSILYKDLKYNFDNNFITEEEYKRDVKELFNEYSKFNFIGDDKLLFLDYLTLDEIIFIKDLIWPNIL